MSRIDSIPPSVHDARLRSVSIDKRTFSCVIDTEGGDELEFIVSDVETLCVNNFYAGNIILDIRVLSADGAQKKDVQNFFDANVAPDPDKLLEKLKAKQGSLFLLDASYGAIVGVGFLGDLQVNGNVG